MDDQILRLSIPEPPGICIQDFLRTPPSHGQLTEKSPFEVGMRAFAFSQIRICDLIGAIDKTELKGSPEVAFNLSLRDPVDVLCGSSDFPDPGENAWSGISGEFEVLLGPNSSARRGFGEHLPVLTASVGAFSRLWFGVAPATTLAISDDLDGTLELLSKLEDVLRLPTPQMDWEI